MSVMQTIASIYVRTPQGRVTAFSTDSKLPVHLRNLLRAVDGKTVSALLTQQWRAQGDIAGWLSQLESAGLIEDKQASGRASHHGQDSDQIWGVSASLQPASNVHFMRNAQTGHNPANAGAFAMLHNPSWQATSAGGLENDAPVQSLESIMADLTQQVVDVMATFVLTYLPEKAFEVLKDLEALRSLGQLRATLPTYEMMVNSAGQAGRQHMYELQRLINQQFASA
jgi:hypothetical protein